MSRHFRLVVGAGAATLATALFCVATFGFASAQDAPLEAAPIPDPNTTAAAALPERRAASAPTTAHVAFMASLDGMGDATTRANTLESAQRTTTGIDLWFGVAPEGAR
jgi:hypothetical protein